MTRAAIVRTLSMSHSPDAKPMDRLRTLRASSVGFTIARQWRT